MLNDINNIFIDLFAVILIYILAVIIATFVKRNNEFDLTVDDIRAT